MSAPNQQTLPEGPLSKYAPPDVIDIADNPCAFCRQEVQRVKTGTETKERKTYLQNLLEQMEIPLELLPKRVSSSAFPLCSGCLTLLHNLSHFEDTEGSRMSSKDKQKIIDTIVCATQKGIQLEWTVMGVSPPTVFVSGKIPIFTENFKLLRKAIAG